MIEPEFRAVEAFRLDPLPERDLRHGDRRLVELEVVEQVDLRRLGLARGESRRTVDVFDNQRFETEVFVDMDAQEQPTTARTRVHENLGEGPVVHRRRTDGLVVGVAAGRCCGIRRATATATAIVVTEADHPPQDCDQHDRSECGADHNASTVLRLLGVLGGCRQLRLGFWLRLRRDGRAENRFQRLDQLVLGVVVLVASPVGEIRSLKAPELERDTYLLQQDRHQDVAAQTLGRLGTNPALRRTRVGPDAHDRPSLIDRFLDDLVEGSSRRNLPVPPHRPAVRLGGIGEVGDAIGVRRRVAHEDVDHFAPAAEATAESPKGRCYPASGDSSRSVTAARMSSSNARTWASTRPATWSPSPSFSASRIVRCSVTAWPMSATSAR